MKWQRTTMEVLFPLHRLLDLKKGFQDYIRTYQFRVGPIFNHFNFTF